MRNTHLISENLPVCYDSRWKDALRRSLKADVMENFYIWIQI